MAHQCIDSILQELLKKCSRTQIPSFRAFLAGWGNYSLEPEETASVEPVMPREPNKECAAQPVETLEHL